MGLHVITLPVIFLSDQISTPKKNQVLQKPKHPKV